MKRVFLWAVVAFFCMTTANAGNRDHSADLQQVCQLVLDHPDRVCSRRAVKRAVRREMLHASNRSLLVYRV